MSREITDRLYELMDEGIVDPRAIAEACLFYMSESDVANMAHYNKFIIEEEEDEDEQT